MYGVHMDREWGAGEGHKKKGLQKHIDVDAKKRRVRG